jgi:hypothetical protein
VGALATTDPDVPIHALRMCGRVIQSSEPLKYPIVERLDVRDSRLSNYPRRWNGCAERATSAIRENHKSGERSLDLLRWRLIRSGLTIRQAAASRLTRSPRQSPVYLPSRKPARREASLHPAGRRILRMAREQAAEAAPGEVAARQRRQSRNIAAGSRAEDSADVDDRDGHPRRRSRDRVV